MIVIVIILVFLTVTVSVVASYMFLTAKQQRLDNRLDKYLDTEDYLARQQIDFDEGDQEGRKKKLIDPELRNKLNELFASFSVTDRLKDELAKTNLPIRASEFITFNLLILFVFGIGGSFVFQDLLITVLLILVGLFAPYLYLKYSQRRRLAKFNDQIADSLSVISNSLKAGYSFFQAMETVSREMSPPISEEFTRVLKEVNLGNPAEEALESLTERVDSDDLDLVITAVLIQRQVGGNLSEILDSISHTIRERIRIQGEIKTLTAQGRISGIIVSILPLGLGVLLYVINPEYMTPLFTHPLGQTMLGVALFSQLLGAVLIKKVVTIQV